MSFGIYTYFFEYMPMNSNNFYTAQLSYLKWLLKDWNSFWYKQRVKPT